MKLEIGYNHSFEIRRETCYLNCIDNFSILYLSDLHLNKFSQSIYERIVKSIEELDPSIILLGGDYVDSQRGLNYLNLILNSISQRKNVYAVAGNHDYFIGIEKIKKSMFENNITWIENKSVNINLGNSKIKIDGNFIKNEIGIHDFSILLLHKPKHLSKFADSYNIALAGHLHGSQFVFWKSENKLFPGKLFYKWNILKTQQNNCHYFISKGLGDTLPIRYNCKKDLIFIQVLNTN